MKFDNDNQIQEFVITIPRTISYEQSEELSSAKKEISGYGSNQVDLKSNKVADKSKEINLKSNQVADKSNKVEEQNNGKSNKVRRRAKVTNKQKEI